MCALARSRASVAIECIPREYICMSVCVCVCDGSEIVLNTVSATHEAKIVCATCCLSPRYEIILCCLLSLSQTGLRISRSNI